RAPSAKTSLRKRRIDETPHRGLLERMLSWLQDAARWAKGIQRAAALTSVGAGMLAAVACQAGPEPASGQPPELRTGTVRQLLTPPERARSRSALMPTCRRGRPAPATTDGSFGS